ncbi:DEAD/DEAH box helicase [Bradyrhizobium sp. 176]|uniref:DEAD/DEAH box helicase n=1 Tax=Bradyrhizobium sp. 176 TaxID=2782646 RepID=UPI001FF9E760|nr:DEAD/DEAH box helicase [Bradyrhizobium sp. 176]
MIRTVMLPVEDWIRNAARDHAVIRVLLSEGVRTDDYSVCVDHEKVARLPGSIAEKINLPPLSRLSVTLTFEGRIDTPEGSIRARWYDERTRSIVIKRTGAFVTAGDETSRLTFPFFRVLEAVDVFNESAGLPMEQRISKWQPVQDALSDVTGSQIKTDGFLGSLTIYQAGSFALDTRETVSGPDFVPILMSRHKGASLDDNAPAEDDDDDGGDVGSSNLRDGEADALLPPELQKRFADERFSTSANTRDAYVLGRNTYVVIDPDLKVGLDVVRRMRRAPIEARRAFIRNPRPIIAEALGRDDADAAAVSLFVETKQYSDRVLGLGIWDPPKLPWIKRKSEQWAPETFPVVLRGETFEFTPDQITAVVEQLATARRDGRDHIQVERDEYPISEVEAAISGLQTGAREQDDEHDQPSQKPEETSLQDDNVLLIKQNIDGVEHQLSHPRRPLRISRAMPEQLLSQSRPKPHQAVGFKWLVDAWEAGWPGVLLADDMGLGKTFQTLAFMAWIRANKNGKSPLGKQAPAGGPILIVAPTALLRNWIAEAELHLAPGALGDRLDAFGPNLKRIKRAKGQDWTPEDSIDVEQLRQADWILTTYETLADNHRAFARVPCSLAVFDEMQKVKSPGTINTHAAKAMNADFVLGLTGTPIENRLEDLWCIMDRVAPGYLGDLKTFSATHTEDSPEALTQLKAKLDEPQDQRPAVMLRRMKEQILIGLPKKTIEPYRVDMPPVQSEAYAKAVRAAQSGERTPGAMLAVIHALRSISLHPDGEAKIDAYDHKTAMNWIEQSARMKQVFSILNSLEKTGEKALVFVEHRDVQATFAAATTSLLGLRKQPAIINGTTPGPKRQDVVDRFQSGPKGFDLLILSPKAAGVGLTITAASHVIHLSRWWNPAVEDQCNDRVYRIGQSKPVTVHVPMAVHPALGDRSFDINLDKLLRNKRALSRNMLAPPVSDADVGMLFEQAVGP